MSQVHTWWMCEECGYESVQRLLPPWLLWQVARQTVDNTERCRGNLTWINASQALSIPWVSVAHSLLPLKAKWGRENSRNIKHVGGTPPHSESGKGEWKTQVKGKHTIKPLPKNGFGLWYVSPPPFVHALSFSLEETGTDQTNPTFWGLQNWFWRSRSTEGSPPPQNRTIRFAPPPHPNVCHWSTRIQRSYRNPCSCYFQNVWENTCDLFQQCVNGRGRFGGQVAHKNFLGPGSLSVQCRNGESSTVPAGWAIREILPRTHRRLWGFFFWGSARGVSSSLRPKPSASICSV